MEKRLHLKGLNGLRAIAAMCVVIFHIRLPGFQFNYLWPKMLGLYCVTIFFTISGFLITFLLLKEKAKTEISVPKFYMRRILRICPLYFAYMIVALSIIYLQTPEKLPGTLPYYLLFAANIPNILSAGLPYLKHYWSLGAEEQFYLFWPWLIKKCGDSFKAILIFIVFIFILKFTAHIISIKYHTVLFIDILDNTRFECMAIGALGACLYTQKNKIFLWLTSNRLAEILCWLYLCFTAVNKNFWFLNHDTLSVVTVCLIVNLNSDKRPLVNLENRVFDFLGRISYGIYIIHPLVILGLNQLLPRLNMTSGWESAFFFFGVLLFTICFAWVSYEFFEKKFLLLKDKFTVVKNTA